MTANDLTLHDPIDVEREQPDLGDKLRAALGDLGTDEGEFAEGVRTRIAERDQGQSKKQVSPLLSRGLRSAASVLPPILLPKVFTKVGLGTGGALIGKGGSLAGKGGLTGLAALPALTAMMLVITVWVALRSLVRPHADRERAEDSQRIQSELLAWWRRTLPIKLLALASLVALAFFAPGDAITLLLLVSTIACANLFSHLAATGLASRRQIGVRAGGMMLNALSCSVALHDLVSRWTGLRGVGWTTLTLALGAATCFTLALADTRRRLLAALLISAVVIGGFGSLLTTFGSFAGRVQLEPADVRAWVRAVPESHRNVLLWGHLARVAEHWGTTDLEPLDLSALAAQIQSELANNSLNGAHGKLPLLELDLVDEPTWQSWRDLDRNPLVVREEARLWWSPSYDLTARLEARAGSLSDAERALAARNLLNNLPEFDKLGATQDLLIQARTLEELGHTEGLLQLRDRAHEALVATWVLSEDGSMGCFAASPALLESALQRAADSALSAAWVDSTSDAVRVIARWGPPPGVDLLALERWLALRAQKTKTLNTSVAHILSTAALAELRNTPAVSAALSRRQPPSLAARVWLWRIPIAALILVLLAVFTTWRAPIRARDSNEVNWWADVRFSTKRD